MDPAEERKFVDQMKRQATTLEQVRLCELAERGLIYECLQARGVDAKPYLAVDAIEPDPDEEARRRRLRAERQARWRARHPEAVKDKGDAER
jgi:hypothetical protein